MNIVDHNGRQVDIENIEKIEQDLANYYIKETDIVLELGARYGSVSCIINSKLNCKTNQVVVEPDPRVWGALERNKIINECDFHIVRGFISTKKLGLTAIDSWDGYGTTSIEDTTTLIPSFTLQEIEGQYDLKFNVLVADCEGFLEVFFDENPQLYDTLRLIIFEADYPQKCNYTKIRETLKEKGFSCILEVEIGNIPAFQNVWVKL